MPRFPAAARRGSDRCSFSILAFALLALVVAAREAPAQLRGEPTASVTGVVWSDLDRDGVRDAGEPGLEGIRVDLWALGGEGPEASTTTAVDGSYALAGTLKQDHYVRLPRVAELRVTLRDVGDDATDSDFDRFTRVSPPFTGDATFDVGLAPSELGRLDLQFDFGALVVGESATLPVIVENIESHAVTLVALPTVSSSGFTLSAWDCGPAPVTLQPGEACLADFGFSPTGTVRSSGTVGIETEWNDTSVILRWSGRGAEPVYIDPSASPGGSGATWGDAFASFEEAVATRGSANEFWIAGGVLRPPSTVVIPSAIEAVVGSFAGGEVWTRERDLSAGPTTVITGDLADDDTDPDNDDIIADGDDIQGTNLPRLLEKEGTVLLDGLVLTGGDSALDESAVFAVDLEVYDTLVVGNRGASSVTLNTGTVVRTRFLANAGTALTAYGPNNLSVISSSFLGNRSSGNGGAIVTIGMNLEIESSLFAGNAADGAGGALLFVAIEGRGAKGLGILDIQRSTFADNVAGTTGGAISAFLEDVENEIEGSIFWGNRDSGLDAADWFLHSESPLTVFVQNSNVEGSGGSSAWNADFGADGGGNLDVDPLFVAPTGAGGAPSIVGDYRLQATSPLIDLGRQEHPDESVDADGQPRLVGSAVDLGALELPRVVIFTDGFESGDTTAWQ